MFSENATSTSASPAHTHWDSTVLQRLGPRNLMCYHSVTDGYTSHHRHPGREILFVRSGEGVYISGDRAIPLEAPSLVWIDSRFPHGPDMKGRYERWNVVALPHVRAAANSDDRNAEDPFQHPTTLPDLDGLLPQGVAVTQIPKEYVSRVEELFTTIGEELNRAAPFAYEILTLKLTEIDLLFRRFLGHSTTTAQAISASDHDPKIAAAIDYIESHLDQELTAASLSELLHYSRAQVYRLIRWGTGCSLGEYVRMRRIAKAKRLLRSTTLTIKEIARLVGYPHPPHFCKVFREITNLTPTQYREQFTP